MHMTGCRKCDVIQLIADLYEVGGEQHDSGQKETDRAGHRVPEDNLFKTSALKDDLLLCSYTLVTLVLHSDWSEDTHSSH